jgi:excisionase family DNA binding protein
LCGALLKSVISFPLQSEVIGVRIARKPMRERNRLYGSSQVAKVLGVSVRTLYRMLAAGRIPEPMRDPKNGYRVWTEVDIQAIREALGK